MKYTVIPFFLILLLLSCKDKTIPQKKINKEVLSSELNTIVSTSPLLDSIFTEVYLASIQSNQYNFSILSPNAFQQIDQIKETVFEMDSHGLKSYFSPLRKKWQSLHITNDSLLQLAVSQENYEELLELEILAALSRVKINEALEFGITHPDSIYQNGYYVPVNKPDKAWYQKQIQGEWLSRQTDVSAIVKNPRYKKLQEKYATLDFEKKQASWISLPNLNKAKIEPNDSYVGAPILRQHLNLEPISDTNKLYHVYDAELVKAVKEFQSSYGLLTDGIIGPATFRLLNQSPFDIQKKIEASLERFRWNIDVKEDHLLLVNIPEFQLYFYKNGKLIRKQKVGVGINNERLQTPEFIDTLEKIVVNPKWYVPKSIATLEILPKAQNDPNYLLANNYTMYQGSTPISPFDVDLLQYNPDNFPYRIEQGVGDTNSLGRVKFLFPNQYSIYLHDTPSKYIFNRDNRSVSHGCIRLQNPFQLADDLLSGYKGYETAREDEETKTFYLKDPKYTVHISYFTSWVDENNNLQLRNDVYNRDKVLLDHLAQLKVF